MRSASADSAAQALDRLHEALGRGAPYDLAILDMEMPGKDGLELARAIKADPKLAATTLVMLTSTTRSIVREASDAGIAACVTKPVRQAALYTCLAEALGRSRAAAPPAAPPPSPPSPPPPVGTPGGPHILVAEDNIVNQEVARGILEARGYRVTLAENGREAVEALATTAYAAVLMDCQMPEMDGYEATAEIRRREEASGARTPIIALTANALSVEREKCLAVGMDDYLAKPIHADDLYAALERYVGAIVAAGPHAH
jgi:CheY-like chemotaxis protein